MAELEKWEVLLVRALRRANYWGRRRLPSGVRSVVGLLFVIGGIFGFLPILGFWMIPVGLYFMALEFPFLRRPMNRWLIRRKVSARRG